MAVHSLTLKGDHLVGDAGDGVLHRGTTGHDGLFDIGLACEVCAAALEQRQLNAAHLRAGLFLYDARQQRGEAAELRVAKAVRRAGLGLGHEAAIGIMNALGHGDHAAAGLLVDALDVGKEGIHVKIGLRQVDEIGACAVLRCKRGGVKVDTNGETSIKRLYALGETSCTGLHGANRLASNSLIEAVVYADQAARHTASLLEKVDFQEGIPDWDFEGTQHTEEMLMIIQSKREMQTIMSNYVGIVRSNLSLKRAMHRLEILWQETEELYNKTKPNRELCELRNMIAIAYLVIKQGREIKESVGCHYNADYPKE